MDIIHLLPDSVANQIAAGEVIQRPASVIKELMENAIDAGASAITVVVKDAGRTLIQVIDDGKGMSQTDARMAFERHATSKIKGAKDLFSLRTMGFRGEALPSIAAVAQVELRSRRHEDEVGTYIAINASVIDKQEDVAMACGTNFSVKNLFFNIPARRKFLKADHTEMNHIITDFQRIALVYPEIAFTLLNNNTTVFQLPPATSRGRIVDVFGKYLNQQLLEIHTDSTLVRISGFVASPDFARKKGALQYFFVNGRYMRHPYFHRAVMQAYQNMLPSDSAPNYFIYFDIEPDAIDVNIHPSKTEIKFENETAIWSIITASVREALGKFNVVPSIDFDQEGAAELDFSFSKTAPIHTPKVDYNPSYNPFRSTATARPQQNWEVLYQGIEKHSHFSQEEQAREEILVESSVAGEQLSFNMDDRQGYFQFAGRYIITAVKSGMMLIDQRRAHTRVLFERYFKQIKERKGVSQTMLFPEMLELTPVEAAVLSELKADLLFLGFDMESLGGNTFAVNGIPADLKGQSPKEVVEQMIDAAQNKGGDVKEDLHTRLALSLARSLAVPYGKTMTGEEISALVDALFACPNPNHLPDGKNIISILTSEELEKRFTFAPSFEKHYGSN
jgi:DNA mismatch repair protein MutL